jgi:integrase
MSVKVREQRGKLYLDIYQSGVRKWESLHITLTNDKKQNKELWRLAEICRSKREAQLLTGHWDIKDQIAGQVSLLQFCEDYAQHYTDRKIINSLMYHIKRYTNGSTIQIGKITGKWVEDFQKYLLENKKKDNTLRSQTTVAGYIRVLCAILRKAVSSGIIRKDPSVGVNKVPRLEADLVFLNIDELQCLANTIPDSPYEKEIRRAFLFSCYTGLRISDIETITWSRIENKPPQIIKRQKKTRNPVFIPLSKSAQALIFDNKEHRPDDKIFDFLGHKCKLSYRHLKKWGEEAGLKKHISWHTARRTFATLALESGVDAIIVAKLLGHKDLRQVMVYAKATDEMKRKAIASLPELKLPPV